MHDTAPDPSTTIAHHTALDPSTTIAHDTAPDRSTTIAHDSAPDPSNTLAHDSAPYPSTTIQVQSSLVVLNHCDIHGCNEEMWISCHKCLIYLCYEHNDTDCASEHGEMFIGG